jgi:catechol 2,3-dioxygenase-like lactoylglutathione lyase family enzyme
MDGRKMTATILGPSHLTLAVRSIERSVDFYVGVLGCQPAARWPVGAYLSAGGFWLALVEDKKTRSDPLPQYTHFAFHVSAEGFAVLAERIRNSGAQIFQENETEGESLYFLDPDGHKLEIHVGDLQSRLDHARQHPRPGLEVFI